MDFSLYRDQFRVGRNDYVGEQILKRVYCQKLLGGGDEATARELVGGNWDVLLDDPLRGCDIGLTHAPASCGDGIAVRHMRNLDLDQLAEGLCAGRLSDGFLGASVNEQDKGYAPTEIFVSIDIAATDEQIKRDVLHLVKTARAGMAVPVQHKLPSGSGRLLSTIEKLLADADRGILQKVKATSTTREELASQMFPDSIDPLDSLKSLVAANKTIFTVETGLRLQRAQRRVAAQGGSDFI